VEVGRASTRIAEDARRGLPFLKGHGTGNDFVVLPDAEGRVELSPDLVRRLCDRRFGIGGDGILRVVPVDRVPASELPHELATISAGDADADVRWFMDYHNADGSLAEMCGNGVRVYSRFLVDAGWEAAGELRLATRGGIKTVTVPEVGDVTVGMGPPELRPGPVKAELGGRTFEGQPVSMGNPHLVVRLDSEQELAALDLTPDPTVPEAEFPTGVNLEFYVPGPTGRVGGGVPLLEMRVHERGVGETLSCGTGACAVAVAAAGRPGEPVDVRVPGGRLRVQWTDETVLLTGPAELVAEGRWLG
jgi:diaminopimelate epimerase